MSQKTVKMVRIQFLNKFFKCNTTIPVRVRQKQVILKLGKTRFSKIVVLISKHLNPSLANSFEKCTSGICRLPTAFSKHIERCSSYVIPVRIFQLFYLFILSFVFIFFLIFQAWSTRCGLVHS